jgi:hypothetical protein
MSVSQLLVLASLGALAQTAPTTSTTSPTAAMDPAACPLHAQHMATRAQEVDAHGDHAMGFPHSGSQHHFRLAAGGGAIEVEAVPADTAVTTAIRGHLRQITDAFASGDFSTPQAVHGFPPPGVDTMARRRADITYRYEDLPNGARVRITSADAEALAAIHAFLRFQIDDHRTGDPLAIEPRPGA